MSENAICVRCGKPFPFTDEFFCKNKKCKSGLSHVCKKCRSEKNKSYREANSEKIKLKKKEYYSSNKDDISQKQRLYYSKNKDSIIRRAEDYQSNHREQQKQYQRKCYERHRDEYLAKCKEYAASHKEEKRKYNKEYYNKVLKNDVLCLFARRSRGRIREAFNSIGKSKNMRFQSIVGLSPEEFRDYLLRTYCERYGESWDGKEQVHIDHIVPIKSAKTEEEILALCHFSNLQLLKAKDNLKKGSKIDYTFERR